MESKNDGSFCFLKIGNRGSEGEMRIVRKEIALEGIIFLQRTTKFAVDIRLVGILENTKTNIPSCQASIVYICYLSQYFT